MPFIDVCFLLYAKGWLAVELFFSLSGFIFFWLYSKAIAQDTVSAREFFVLRFSRLYPLHFATLLAVAGGQLAYHQVAGNFFIYAGHEAKPFRLNPLFFPSFGLGKGWSFHSPGRAGSAGG